jgi:DNA-binding IclR family transcriptional regulator
MGCVSAGATRASVTARLLAILAAFDERHPSRTLTELAAAAGLPVSTAHRLVGELAAWDALAREPDGRYVVGRRLWTLTTLAPLARDLREAALPAMQDVYEVTRENVQIAVREGAFALYVDSLHGPASVPVLSRPGVPLPLHATGVGKVLLAWAPRDVRESVLEDLRPVTRHTVTERGRLSRELAAVRRRGYARTGEEMTLGTCSIAVPVVQEGRVVAALGLVTSTVRRDTVRFVPALKVASSSITHALTT